MAIELTYDETPAKLQELIGRPLDVMISDAEGRTPFLAEIVGGLGGAERRPDREIDRFVFGWDVPGCHPAPER